VLRDVRPDGHRVLNGSDDVGVRRQMVTRILVAGMLALVARTAGAQNMIVLDEVLGSWLGDDEVQYVELRMLSTGQSALTGVAALVFDDATASTDGQRVYGFQQSVAQDGAGVKILVATSKASTQAGVTADFVLPPGFIHPKAGRICYAVAGTLGLSVVDCVAYGDYTGPRLTFGPPTAITPDNRVLRRTQQTGKNRADWIGALDPKLQNNAGAVGPLPMTLCGDGNISQGEECDGTALAGATCASLGFAKGKLLCTQCHYDVSKCTSCGNDAINGSEECDGSDLGDRTCESLGFTGGTLDCTDTCTLTTAGCDATFFVPGGGPPKTDCLAEWQIMNASARPGGTGAAPSKQRCRDGDVGCDADGVRDGTCTFSVAPCFARSDARLAKCQAAAITSWTLLGKVDPSTPAIAALVASVASLGPATPSGTTVTFAPPLATADACGPTVEVPVAVGTKLVLRARTTGPDGKPKDVDVLRLVCAH
jgi:hypothetical protein